MKYAYRVRTTQGNVVEGSMEANDQQAVIAKLREQKFIILDVSETKGGGGGFNLIKPKVKKRIL